MENKDLQAEVAASVDEQDGLRALPVAASYALATLGSKTKRGGTVRTASSKVCCDELLIARVGDEVHYPDGAVAYITSGAGSAAVFDGNPLAIVGSHVGDVDEITETLSSRSEIRVCEGLPPIPGLLDQRYAPPRSNR